MGYQHKEQQGGNENEFMDLELPIHEVARRRSKRNVEEEGSKLRN